MMVPLVPAPKIIHIEHPISIKKLKNKDPTQQETKYSKHTTNYILRTTYYILRTTHMDTEKTKVEIITLEGNKLYGWYDNDSDVKIIFDDIMSNYKPNVGNNKLDYYIKELRTIFDADSYSMSPKSLGLQKSMTVELKIKLVRPDKDLYDGDSKKKEEYYTDLTQYVKHNSDSYQIFAKLDKSYVLNVTEDCTINDVKLMLEFEQNIPSRLIKLVLQNKFLDGSKDGNNTLKFNGIDKLSTLNIFLKRT